MEAMAHAFPAAADGRAMAKETVETLARSDDRIAAASVRWLLDFLIEEPALLELAGSPSQPRSRGEVRSRRDACRSRLSESPHQCRPVTLVP
jgi:hypothetical protein